MINAVTRLNCFFSYLLIMGLFAITSELHAEMSQSDAVTINNIKEQVLELNQELLVLEEDLLFPLNSQVNVFISIDAGFLFKPDLVKLEVDGKVVSNYLYTEPEVQALHRGAVQRIYAGNLKAGKHKLTATFAGKGPSSRVYKRISTIPITKTNETQFVELKIKASNSNKQPILLVKVWE